MKRVWKWARRIATGLGIAALVLGFWVWLVPSIVERVTTAQLEKAGLPKPRLQVRRLSLAHLEMAHLAAGEDDRVRIAAVGIDYDLLQLLRKQVDSVEITGFEAEIRRKNGVWDLGPLADLHGTGDSEAAGDMPFKRIVLHASTLILDLDGRRLRVPFHGSLTNAGPDTLAIDILAGIDSAILLITGTVNTRSQDFNLTLSGDVPELAALLAAVSPQTAGDPGQAWGGLTVKAALARNKGVLSLDASAEGTGWKLSRLKVRETGLDDWLYGKADHARVQFHWEAAADKPWLLAAAVPLKQWIDGEALAKAEFSGDGALEFRRDKAGPEAGWTWSATVPLALATLAPSDLTVPAAGATLEGVRVDLRMAATAATEGLRVELLPHSLATAAGISVRQGDARLALAKGEKPGFELLVGDRPVVASASLREGTPEWKIDAPDVRLALRHGRAEFPDGVIAGVAAATAQVALEASPDKVAATLAVEAAGPVTASAGEEMTAKLGKVRSVIEGAWGEKGGAIAGSLEISGIEAGLHRKFGDTLVAASLPEAMLRVKARHEFPAGRGPGAPLSIKFVVGTPKEGKGLSATAAGAEVAANGVEARGRLTLAGSSPPVIDARLSLTDASVRHKEAGLVLAGITADVPLTWNVTAPPEPGSFVVKSIDLKGAALPAISGTLGVTDSRADFTMACEVLPEAKLRVEGSAAGGPRGPSARAYVSLPLFQIKDEEAIGRLVPQLKGVLASGSFALDGYVRVSPAGVAPNIALTVLDGTVKSKAWEAEAEGVYATVRIGSFEPVLTPRKELQVVLVRRAKMGKLEVNDGFVAFRLEPKETEGRPTSWTAYVQRGEWGWVGGRLYVEDFRFDPEAKEHTVTLHARDLKLGGLLALIPDEEAGGVGSLDGKLPVTIGTWPNLRFGNGELRTTPGQAGWFKLKNTEVLGTVLEGTDKRFRTDDLYVEIKNRLIGAFKNFEYDEINVGFLRDGEKFVARVNTKGRARTGVRQEFGEVTLNFPDFDKVLRDVILVSKGVFGN